MAEEKKERSYIAKIRAAPLSESDLEKWSVEAPSFLSDKTIRSIKEVARMRLDLIPADAGGPERSHEVEVAEAIIKIGPKLKLAAGISGRRDLTEIAKLHHEVNLETSAKAALKTTRIKEVIEDLGLLPQQVVVFDDKRIIIDHIRRIIPGVKAFQTRKGGLTVEQLQRTANEIGNSREGVPQIKLVLVDFDGTLAVKGFKGVCPRNASMSTIVHTYMGGYDRMEGLRNAFSIIEREGGWVGFLTFNMEEILCDFLIRLGWV